MRRPVVIVGGGLAGIAAAVRLAECADVRPILLESRRGLGGRATSVLDPRSDEVIDNCQHVLMGCCTNLLDLYERLGVLERIEWHREFYWTAGRGQIDTLRAGLWPAPFHLAGGLRRLRLFDRAEKRCIARTMWRMIRMGAGGRLAWRDRTFRAFLDEAGQSERLVRRFWDTIIVSACNLPVERVAASLGLQVFQEGFLGNRWSYTMGLPAVPLRALYDPAAAAIEAAGGEIRLGWPAKALAFDGRRVSGVVGDEGIVEAAAVVVAVPFDRLDRLVSDTMRQADRRLRELGRFEVSPILGVHLWFDAEIMDRPHLTLLDHGVQWLFNKGLDARGRQHVHAVISAADGWMDLGEDEIVERVVADVHDVLPRSIGLRPVVARAIKERRATFAAVPGIDAYRPSAEPAPIGASGGGIRNLYLAGDWTDSGWPATMEGAVRSGYLAARAATGAGGLVEDVPAGLLARTLGLR